MPYYLLRHNVERRGLVRVLVSAPFIYGMIVPLVFAHGCALAYEAICFPLYGLPKVERRRLIRDFRGQLPYLSWLDRLNCHYCGYANGVIAYLRELALRTEQAWCPIRNKLPKGDRDLPHRKSFAAYGKEAALTDHLKKTPHPPDCKV
jgi:hypothetical protein